MKVKRIAAVTAALWVMAQMVIIPVAKAGSSDPGAGASAGAISILATVIAAPVKLAACVATVLIGGTAYGLTMGTSELLREELAAGTKHTCGGKYVVTPQEIKHVANEP